MDKLLLEEQKILENKRKKSQEQRAAALNISDDMDLLSYNEYIANAKVAKKKKNQIETNSQERSNAHNDLHLHLYRDVTA